VLSFEDIYPNAKAGLPEHYKQRMVNLHKYNQSLVEGFVPLPSDEDWSAYLQWRAGREVKSFFDFTEGQQRQIEAAVLGYEKLNLGQPVDFYIGGSYSDGSWITADTPQNEKDIRAKIKKLKVQSDIDLIPAPMLGPMHIGNIDINTISKTRGVKIRSGFCWY
jgi:hypothetical protein